MITTTLNSDNLVGTCTRPDDVCFAYNPNFVQLEISEGDYDGSGTLSVSSDTGTFTLGFTLYGGSAKVYLSRTLQLVFDDMAHLRSKDVTITISLNVDGVATQVCSFTLLVVCGLLPMGERFDTWGAYPYDERRVYFRQKLVWFRGFPFTVSMFSATALIEGDLRLRYGGSTYDSTLRAFGCRVDAILSDTPSYDADTLASSEGTVVYCQPLNRFLLQDEDGNYYAQWEATDAFDAVTAYMDGDTPKTGVVFRCGDRFMMYDSQAQALVVCPWGNAATSGIFEVVPAQLFPQVRSQAVMRKDADDTVHVFDSTFDHTFITLGVGDTLIRLQVEDRTKGCYLRWVDAQGFIRYYLFDEGTLARETSLSDSEVEDSREAAGMLFHGHVRTAAVTTKRRQSCCAVSLTEDIYSYVVSVVSSPMVDMYLGESPGGVPLWVPVKVKGGTTTHQAGKVLRDLELSVYLPELVSQTL